MNVEKDVHARGCGGGGGSEGGSEVGCGYKTAAAPTLPASDTTCVPTFVATLVQVSAG